MKITDFVFVFVFFLSLSLLTWTTITSIENPVQHENLFSTNYKYVEANFNKIKADEIKFKKSSSLKYDIQGSKIFIDISSNAKIISTRALLTRPHTNKDNQELKVLNKDLKSLEIELPKLTIGMWKVNVKMEVELNGDKLTIYQHIPIDKGNS